LVTTISEYPQPIADSLRSLNRFISSSISLPRHWNSF